MKFSPFFGSPIRAVQARGSMAVLLQKDGLRDGQRRSRDHLLVDLRQRLADLQSCHVRAFRRRPRRRGEYLAIGATAQQPWQQQLVRLVFLPSPRTKGRFPSLLGCRTMAFSVVKFWSPAAGIVCATTVTVRVGSSPSVLSPHPTGDLPLLDHCRLRAGTPLAREEVSREGSNPCRCSGIRLAVHVR